MELIEIISTILLFGGGLLIFIVCISFFLSRLKKEEPVIRTQQVPTTINIRKSTPPIIRFTQPKKENNLPTPQIFQLEQIRPREIKMIRKLTFQETFGKTRSGLREPHQTKSNNDRYKIINEEQKKNSEQVVNYF